MWKFRSLSLIAALALSLFLPDVAGAQAPPAIVTRVMSSGPSEGYHFKIRTFNNEGNWNDIDNNVLDGNDTEEPFFPIGWYADAASPAIWQSFKDKGITVVQMYAHDVLKNYPSATCSVAPCPYSEYERALQDWTDDLALYGLKAIIDLDPFIRTYDQVKNNEGYTLAHLQQLATKFRGNPNVFAWMVVEEPDQDFKRTDGSRSIITANAINAVATTVLQYDNTHPRWMLPLKVNSQCPYASDSRFNNMFDIFGSDPYVFNSGIAYDESLLYDENFGFIRAHSAMNTVKSRNKWGTMMILQGHDQDVGINTITDKEMLYQTISPLLQGTRGLVYWMHDVKATDIGLTSADVETKTHNVIKFLTRKDNVKNVSLVEVLMSGTDKKAQLDLNNILIDGQSSFTIHQSPVSINSKNTLEQEYTYRNFNKSLSWGNIFKKGSGNSWQQTTLNLPSDATRTHILALHAWNNQVFAANASCRRVQTTTSTISGNTTWLTLSPDCPAEPTHAFATSAAGILIGAAGSHLYQYNAAANTWSTFATIRTVIDGELTNAPMATSMVRVGNALIVGTAGDKNQGIYRSTNNGGTWNFNPSYRHGTSEKIWSLAANAQGTIFAGGDAQIFRSTDNGVTWTITATGIGTSKTIPNYSVWSLECPSNGVIYAGTGDGLYSSTDNGGTWNKISGLPDRTQVWDMAADASYLYAATSKGVYRVSLYGTPNTTLYIGTPGDPLCAKFNTPGTYTECRAITIDNIGNVYVGTREYTNSFANTQDESGFINGGSDYYSDPADQFSLFNYTIKKHEGSYYLFAVNDFRPTVQVDFNLNNVLENNETIYRISELNIDGSEIRRNAYDSHIGEGAFPVSFGAYEAKVFRIDVLQWSDVHSITRECSNNDPDLNSCTTDGAGVTIADFDGDRQKDFLVMWVPDFQNRKAEPFRYKIGWNMQKSLSSAIVTYASISATASTNFPANACFGEAQAIAWDVQGADVKAYSINTSNTVPDVFFTGVDGGTNQFRTKINWNMNAVPFMSAVQSVPSYYDNFPITSPSYLFGQAVEFKQGPFTASTGVGVTLYQKANEPNPRMVLMHLANNPAGANQFTTIQESNLYLSTPNNVYTQFNYTNSSIPRVNPSSIGWETKGAGIDIGNLAPSYSTTQPDKYQEMVCGGIPTVDDAFRFIVYDFDQNTGDINLAWRPFVEVPLKPDNYKTGQLKDAGLALGDIDGDGDDDLIIMATNQESSGECHNRLIFLRFGINTLINDPAKSFRKEAVAEQVQQAQAQQPTPGTPVHTTLGNQPNPFNTGTVVNYSIDKAARVEMEIYSMLGTVVYRVDAGIQQAGSYSLPFQAGTLPNGIYMCRLKVDGTVVNATKMVLAR